MIKFSQEKVLLLHKLITEETGGDPNVRDIALLNSALKSAFATFDGQELYPTKQERVRVSVFRSSQTTPLWTETSELVCTCFSRFSKPTASNFAPPTQRWHASGLPSRQGR